MDSLLIAFLAFGLGCCVGGLFTIITMHEKYDLYAKEKEEKPNE